MGNDVYDMAEKAYEKSALCQMMNEKIEKLTPPKTDDETFELETLKLENTAYMQIYIMGYIMGFSDGQVSQINKKDDRDHFQKNPCVVLGF